MKLQENSSFEELKKQAIFFYNKSENLTNEISNLKEQLSWLQKQIFGKKSEKIIDLNQDQLFFEGFEPQKTDDKKTKQIKAHTKVITKKDKTKITIPPDLEVKRIIIDIPEKEKICPLTNKPLIKIGEEISHKLAFTPGSYYLKEIVRLK